MEVIEVVVVPSADKAVSTEDLGVVTRDIHLEVARLEAMLNTLVENKVEAMKADKARGKETEIRSKHLDKHTHRITSTSTTASSSQQQPTRAERQKRCLLEESPIKSRHSNRHEKRHVGEEKNSAQLRTMPLGGISGQQIRRIRPCCEHNLPTTMTAMATPGFIHSDDEDDDQLADEAFDFLTYADQQHRTYSPCPYPCSCSYTDNHNGQIITVPYDEDYVSINMELDLDLVDVIDEEAMISHHAMRRARRKKRKRRRRKRRRERLAAASAAATAAATAHRDTRKVLDADDLPQRARWTIVATACLLLLMCLLLVGVTLRMAPIIDDMVRKENEELLNALSRESNTWNATNTTPVPVVAIGV